MRVEPLGDRFGNLFRAMLARRAPEALTQVPAKVWKQNWVVHSQPAGSGQKALEYLSRYIFKTATGDRRVVQQADGNLLWSYRESQTGRRCHVLLETFELIWRFLQHVLPRSYTRVRSLGWFHPAARVWLNRVRGLLKQKPLLTEAEQEAWLELEPWETKDPLCPEPTASPDPRSVCPRCGVPMELRDR